MKVLTAALVFAFAALSTPAGAATVHGSVVQQSVRTVRPVANVLLTVRSAAGLRSARVFSDRSGEFWFYDLPNGKYLLEIWRNGMDDSNPRTLEACRFEVTGSDVSLPKLRLHNSTLRLRPEFKNCGEGLEHLYTSG